ncbi:MAG: hypothetical protein IJ246_11225 [Clostridia bacterium]|nr:hypothetical protein [Clostridia bacterium]
MSIIIFGMKSSISYKKQNARNALIENVASLGAAENPRQNIAQREGLFYTGQSQEEKNEMNCLRRV